METALVRAHTTFNEKIFCTKFFCEYLNRGYLITPMECGFTYIRETGGNHFFKQTDYGFDKIKQ